MTAGLLLFVYFLWSVARGPESYARIRSFLANPLSEISFIILAWSFSYHLLAGIRHPVIGAAPVLVRR